MSANHAATPEVSALAQAAAQPLAPAGELAKRFPLSASDHRASDAQRQQALDELRFGTVFLTTWRMLTGAMKQVGLSVK